MDINECAVCVCVRLWMWTKMECKCGMHESNLFITLFPSFHLSHSIHFLLLRISCHRTHTHILRSTSLSKSYLHTIRNTKEWRKNNTCIVAETLLIGIAIISMSAANSLEVKKKCGMHFHKIFQHFLCSHLLEPFSSFRSRWSTHFAIFYKLHQIEIFRNDFMEKVKLFWEFALCRTMRIQSGKMHASSTISEQNRHETCDLGMIMSQWCCFVKYWLSTSKIY